MAADVLTRSDPTRAADAERRWLDLRLQPLDLNGPSSRPYRRIDAGDIERPIFGLICEVAERYPDHIATDDGVRQLTYGELCTASRRLAAVLGTSAPARAPVGVLLPNDAHYPIAVLACLAAGNPCVLLDCNYPAARNATIIADAGIAAVILAEDNELPPAEVTAIRIDAALAPDGPPPSEKAAEWAPDEPAFVIYTSGSTGRPKGIALAQRTFTHRSAQLIDALHLNADDRMMPLGSPCTVAGLLQMFEALLAGAMLIKIDLQRVGIGVVLDAIERKQATTLLATPALLRGLCSLADAPRRMASLRCVHAAGDVLLNVDVERLRRHLSRDCLLLVTYGATEAPAMCHWFVAADAATGAARVASGYPLPDYRYAMTDEDGALVGPEEPGELTVCSRYTALGEWQGGRLVPGPFIPDPDDPASRILRTGDLVSRREDGLMTVLGRRDRLVKIRGMRAEPYEIECVLRRSTEVADAAVLVRRDGDSAILVAFVVLEAATDKAAIDRLRARLRENLPAYMQPARLHTIESLPLLPGHKIDEARLMALDDQSDAVGAANDVRAALPRNGAMAHVAAAWEGVLDRISFDADLPYDQAGGDSLSLLMLVCDIERRCGVELPLLHFDQAMRPSEMGATVERIADSTTRPGRTPPATGLVLLKSGSKAPPVFLMHGLGGHVAELAELARHLVCDHSVYALQLPGLDEAEQAFDRIEDMAASFVGPVGDAAEQERCLLIGYSLGGLIAFDLACRLEANGRKTRLLLLDTYPHPRFWPLDAWLQGLADRFGRQCRQLTQYRPSRFPAYAQRAARSLANQLRARGGFHSAPQLPAWLGEVPTLRRVRAGMVTATRRYRPPRYSSTVAFVQPEIRQKGVPTHPNAAWRRHVAGLSVVDAPGDHLSMALDHAEFTGRLIDRWIEEQSA